MDKNKFTIGFKWLNRVLYASLLLFLGSYLWRNISGISAEQFQPQLDLFFLSIFLVFSSYFLNNLLWNKFAKEYGVESGFMLSSVSWFQSQLGKYIPGKVSLVLFRVNAYPQHLRAKVALAAIFEYISTQTASCFIILLALYFSPLGLPEYIRVMALIGVLASLLILWPSFFKRLANTLLTLFKRPLLTKVPRFKALFLFVLAYIVTIFMQSFAFFLIIASFTDLDISQSITIAGIYQAASLVGIFAVFAPAGLGVREGVLLLALSLLVPESAAITGVLAMRLMTIAAELFFAMVMTGLNYKNQQRS